MATRTTQGSEPAANVPATRFQLPVAVPSSTPENNVKAEDVLNGIIVIRGTGRLINAQLGPCRPILFQFTDNYQEVGPIPLSVGHEPAGPYAVVDRTIEEMGIWQFLASETSPAMRVARDITATLRDNRFAAATGVLRAVPSKANPGQHYYAFEPPEDDDVAAQAQMQLP